MCVHNCMWVISLIDTCVVKCVTAWVSAYNRMCVWMISLMDDRFAESARRAGLEAYKVSDLKKAQQLFSEAIKYENNNCVHFCNRCQVHLAMRRFVAANNDADAALALGKRLIFSLHAISHLESQCSNKYGPEA